MSRKASESGRPFVDVKFSDSAYPSPMWTPPSICSAHSLGVVSAQSREDAGAVGDPGDRQLLPR